MTTDEATTVDQRVDELVEALAREIVFRKVNGRPRSTARVAYRFLIERGFMPPVDLDERAEDREGVAVAGSAEEPEDLGDEPKILRGPQEAQVAGKGVDENALNVATRRGRGTVEVIYRDRGGDLVHRFEADPKHLAVADVSHDGRTFKYAGVSDGSVVFIEAMAVDESDDVARE